MTEHDVTAAASDEALIEEARAGSERAFAELWRRHYRAGIRVAHQFTTLDADDVVSEAFTRIFKTTRAGGGPTGAFRPYLYTCIRNVASTWGAASHDIAVDDLELFEDPTTLVDPAADALDRTLTARAFRSLPERWQTVLWYTEVEGMDPHEVAPVLGMTANGVAALSYRAREGLRKAWLQAHISDATASGECRWALSKLADHARQSLGARDEERIVFHLQTCTKCAIISEEVDEVGSRLASVLMPILLGGAAGGTLLASLNAPSTAMALDVPPLPDLSSVDLASVGAGAAGVAGAAGLAGIITAPVAIVGSIAVAFAIAGTAAIITIPQFTPVTTASPTDEQPDATTGSTTDGGADDTPGADSPIGIPDLDTPPTDGTDGVTDVLDGVAGDVDDLTDAVVDTITGGEAPEGHTAPGGVAGIDLSLAGTGTPGAHLSLQAAGQVYATTTVNPDGTFTINATAVPGGLSSLELVQAVDRSYLASLLPGGGAVEKLLGTLDGVINALIKPLTLTVGSSQVNIVLVS
ncbi:sigma-70 family RNA polymerase sigma factor [Schumannella luteola]